MAKDVLAAAVALHEAGNLKKAERLYRSVQSCWKRYRDQIGTSFDSLKPFAESFGFDDS